MAPLSSIIFNGFPDFLFLPETALKLSKKKKKQLLKILEKKRKKVDREELVAQLAQIKNQTTAHRKKLTKVRFFFICISLSF